MNQGYWTTVIATVGAVSPNFVITKSLDLDEAQRIGMGLFIGLVVIGLARIMAPRAAAQRNDAPD